MPSHKEIEIKLRVADLRALRRQLRGMKARMGKRVHECNVVFDTEDGQFRRRDQLVRLRLNDGAGVVTFKGRSLASPQGRAGKYKVREEIEFHVSNPGATADFLRALGLVATFRYEKYRTAIALPGLTGAQVCLDETPLGVFLEIEGSPQAIDAAARRLGFDHRAYVTQSYLALWEEHRRARGLPMSDLVFPSKEKARRPAVLR